MRKPLIHAFVLAPAIGLVLAAGLALPSRAADATNTGAVGQIEPASGIIDLGGSNGAVVTSVKVDVGQLVKAGQLLMTVEDDTLRAGYVEAAKELERAKKTAAEQVAAQELSVKLAGQQLAQASREYESYKALGPRSTSLKDIGRAKGAVTQAQLSLKIEQSKLEVAKATAANSVADAQRQFKIASNAEEIRAPIDGTILSIGRRVGARLTGPAIRMGDLRTMYVACQVYEGDLLKLRPGMRATIKSETLPHPLGGTVESVGRLIDSRAKLGDVRIRLDRADPANRLVGMEVEVVIAH
jgi:HlyD family secretion protein